MSTLRLPAERAAIQATIRMQSGFYPPLHIVAAPTKVEAKACLNCDAPLGGKFCHHCGQAAKVKRFTFGAFLHELPHELLHLDHAIPHTLLSLLTKPGPTIRAYLDGKRAKIYSPIALYFTLTGLLALAMVTLKLDGAVHLVKSGTDDIVTGSGTSGSAKSVLVWGGSLLERIPELVAHYRAWVQILTLPVIALAPYWILRKRTGFGLGEQVIALTMIGIGDSAISLCMVPLLWLARNHPGLRGAASVFSDIVTLAYTVWAFAEVQKDGRDDRLARWLRSAATCVASYVAAGVGTTFLVVGFLVALGECALVAHLLRHH